MGVGGNAHHSSHYGSAVYSIGIDPLWLLLMVSPLFLLTPARTHRILCPTFFPFYDQRTFFLPLKRTTASHPELSPCRKSNPPSHLKTKTPQPELFATHPTKDPPPSSLRLSKVSVYLRTPCQSLIHHSLQLTMLSNRSNHH